MQSSFRERPSSDNISNVEQNHPKLSFIDGIFSLIILNGSLYSKERDHWLPANKINQQGNYFGLNCWCRKGHGFKAGC